jgi:hypothetical protein
MPIQTLDWSFLHPLTLAAHKTCKALGYEEDVPTGHLYKHLRSTYWIEVSGDDRPVYLLLRHLQAAHAASRNGEQFHTYLAMTSDEKDNLADAYQIAYATLILALADLAPKALRRNPMLRQDVTLPPLSVNNAQWFSLMPTAKHFATYKLWDTAGISFFTAQQRDIVSRYAANSAGFYDCGPVYAFYSVVATMLLERAMQTYAELMSAEETTKYADIACITIIAKTATLPEPIKRMFRMV